MPKVDINDDNIRHCRCSVCPVQQDSACAMERLKTINNTTKTGDFKAEEASILYCSIGKTTCTDLDASKGCMCPSCLVWNENDLQSVKYCLSGDAEEIG